MKQQVRELLVTTKVAEQWTEDFDSKVEELMSLVNKVDTEKQIQRSCEMLDVYKKSKLKADKLTKRKMSDRSDKPFEFLVFGN